MAGRVSDAWLEELRSRVPLEEVVSEYVRLKPKGRRLWGCCPFHNEKTPSFSVDTGTQMYYCFGCHKGGTVFTFLQETERLEFMEAVKILAERAHMELPEGGFRREAREDATPRDRLYQANTEAARWFHANLWKSEGAAALDYLYSRGLSDKDIRHFGLGASPDAWDALLHELTGKGFTEKELVDAGLCGNRTGKVHDWFRGRVMFPIINAQGRVIGFGGRVIGKGEPKYMNTGDTPIYNKRHELFSLNLAKAERDAGRLVLTEGYMDVCSLRKYGVRGVVATCGTALTEEQARLMKRYAPEVVISYDGDGAGQAAAMRALDIMEKVGLPSRVVDYPNGMDPDDFVKANGADGFEKLRRYKPYEYRMMRAADGLDLKTGDGMTEYATRCCGIISRMTNEIERENALRSLSDRSGYGIEVLRRQVTVSSRATAEPERQQTRERRARDKATVLPSHSALLTILSQDTLPDGLIRPEDLPEGILREAAKGLLAGRPIASILSETEDEDDRNTLAQAVNFTALPEEHEERIAYAEECLRGLHRAALEKRASEIEDRIASGVLEDEKKQLYEALQDCLDKLQLLED